MAAAVQGEDAPLQPVGEVDGGRARRLRFVRLVAAAAARVGEGRRHVAAVARVVVALLDWDRRLA